MKIAFIVVNYNTNLEVIKYYKEICSKLKKNQFDFIITDNSEGILEYEELNTNLKEKNIFLYKNTNTGYLQGCNYGLAEYLKQNEYPDWVIVSNSDIEIKSENFYKILEELKEKEKIGVVAPKILTLDGKYQNPFSEKRFSKEFLTLMKNIYSSKVFFLTFMLLQKVRKMLLKERRNNYNHELEIYAAHGSFLILSKRFFQKGGNLNFKSFLYAEESYIAEMCKLIGLKIQYFPKLEILHKENISTSTVESSFKLRCKVESINYILNTFYIGEEDNG